MLDEEFDIFATIKSKLCPETRFRRSSHKLITSFFVIAALLVLFATVFLVLRFQAINELSFTSDNMRDDRAGQVSCANCPRLEIRGGQEFVKYTESFSAENGCKTVIISCGRDRGTQALIQWFNGYSEVIVSFMDEAGQSKVERRVNCNEDSSTYELLENINDNVQKFNVTAIDCIAALMHEEF